MSKSIYQHVMEHGGITIEPSTRTPIKPSEGYFVSLEGHEKRFSIIEDEYIFQAYLDRHIDRARHYERTTGVNAYVGLWLNDGEIFFDVSLLIKDYPTALEFGNLNNQLAIFDIANNSVITLK